jgi:glyoxylase-like metal-dependent hydrolase (beta-lactamase superfamily II)
MLFEQIATGGCQSYLVGCKDKCVATLIDPEISQLDRYQGLLTQHGLRLRYVIDTHTHADHFSASHHLGQTLNVPVVHHHLSPAPFADMRLDDGDILIIGTLRLQALPRDTRDSMYATRRRLFWRYAADQRHGPNRSTHWRCRAAV